MIRSLLVLLFAAVALFVVPPLIPATVRADALAVLYSVLGVVAFAVLFAGQRAQGWPSQMRLGALGNITEKIARAINDMTGMQFIGGVRTSLDFGNITAGLQERLTLTVTGALLGDFAQVAPETDLTAGVSLAAWVSAADTVTVCVSNNTAATAVDLAAIVFRARVVREAKR